MEVGQTIAGIWRMLVVLALSAGAVPVAASFGLRALHCQDAFGNLTSRTANGFVQTFVPDNLNQLASASRSRAYTMSGGTQGGASSVSTS